MGDALLHSTAVYLYAYDPQTRAFAQLSDAVVGCALLGKDGGGCQLLFYNAQKQPLLQLAVTPDAPSCAPQQDNYVTLRASTEQFYSLRFKDAAGVAAFLSAVAFAKAQALATSDASAPTVLVDELALGKDDAKGKGLTSGDVAGLALTIWSGALNDTDGFFTDNPLEITAQPAAELIARDGDLRRVRLTEGNMSDADTDADPLGKALATEALLGMHKNAKRLVTVVAPQTQQWFIATVELVKVKKATRASSGAQAVAPAPAVAQPQSEPVAADAAVNEELVQRMAHLSRAGSEGSGLIASLSSRALLNNGAESSKRSSFAELQAAVAQKYVPVLLPGVQLPGERKPSVSFGAAKEEGASPSRAPSHHESLAAKVIAPLKDPSRASSSSAPPDTTNGGDASTYSVVAVSSSLSSEMDRLMQEQSDLALLRKQLEESKRKLQDGGDDDTAPNPASSSSTLSAGPRGPLAIDPSSRTSSGLGSWQSSVPASSSSTSLALPSSFTPSAPSAGAFGGASASRWDPNSATLDLAHSFQPPPSFLPPPPQLGSAFQPPPVAPPNTFTPSSLSAPFSSRSLVPAQPFSSQAAGGSMEVESGILRLQRSSTSIESTLQDMQSKIDRLLNAQNSLKAGKYTSSTGLFSSSGLSSSSGPTPSSSSSSSAMLLKNLEKALTQREQLQEQNNRLLESREQMESAIEDLQHQHESLQMENRNLLDKLQNGNHLQQEKFRLELRSVQQQLGHAQEQMLVYQEENYRLRSELASKEEQLLMEKAQLQDDARKQLESLQRQLEAQVRQDSRDSVEKVLKEKAVLESQAKEMTAQKHQWDQERDALTNQLRLAQKQLQDERTRSQSVQDSQVQELQAQLQQATTDSRALSQQVEKFRSEKRAIEELLSAKVQEVERLKESNSSQEYAALSELLKEFMNDIYFHFQDAFDEDTEFTGKEIVMAIRKILKQNTMDILARLEEFWQLQAQNRAG